MRRSARFAILALALPAFALSACSGEESAKEAATSSAARAFYDIPDDWCAMDPDVLANLKRTHTTLEQKYGEQSDPAVRLSAPSSYYTRTFCPTIDSTDSVGILKIESGKDLGIKASSIDADDNKELSKEELTAALGDPVDVSEYAYLYSIAKDNPDSVEKLSLPSFPVTSVPTLDVEPPRPISTTTTKKPSPRPTAKPEPAPAAPEEPVEQQAPQAPPAAPAPAPAPEAHSGGPQMEWRTVGPFGNFSGCTQNSDMQPIQVTNCYQGSDGLYYYDTMAQSLR